MVSIWIDGDACPKAIKEIIFKASKRTKVTCTLVANQFIQIPSSPFISRRLVAQGFDQADQVIIDSVQSGDMVITADLALAESCLNKHAYVISPRGEMFSTNSIQQKLAMRDFNEVMRGSGLHAKGQKPLSSGEISAFANQLDRLLAQISRPE